MKSNYKKLEKYIEVVNVRNKNFEVDLLLGVSVNKVFIPSIANTVGTNMAKYKIVYKNQFTYIPDTSRRGDKIGIALLQDYEKALVSQAYTVFKVKDEDQLLPEYLMMWFRRPEFDRYARYKSHGSVREVFDWEEMCEVELPIPSIEKQREIVKEYNTVVSRITLNEKLNQKLEETAQALYKHWFVDFEFPFDFAQGEPSMDGKPYKSSGGEMVFNEELDKEIPVGWESGVLKDIADIQMGQSPKGDSYNTDSDGEIFYQGRTEFGFRYPKIKKYTNEPKKMAREGDILMSVRAPVGDLNVTHKKCCIGRGLASIKSINKLNSYLFYLLKDLNQIFNIVNGEGTIFGSINKDNLNNMRVSKSNYGIESMFNDFGEKIDNEIKIKSFEILNLLELKTLLLSKMTQVEEVSRV